MESTISTSAQDQIAELETQIRQLRDRGIIELKFKISETRNLLAAQQAELDKLTGVTDSISFKRPRRPSVPVTIEEIVEAIKAGASNYTALTKTLGTSVTTVRKTVEREGKAARIRSTGFGPGFRFYIEEIAPVAKAAAIAKPASAVKPAPKHRRKGASLQKNDNRSSKYTPKKSS